MQYITGFSIRGDVENVSIKLLERITDLVLDELRAASHEITPDLEKGDTAGIGYSSISAERPHPSLPEHHVRLEAQFCTKDDSDVAARVRTRFISADGSEPLGQVAGPPKLLRAIVDQFQCTCGITPLTNNAFRVTSQDSSAFVTEHILNVERRIPILAISEDRSGQRALDPDGAQRHLTGIAQVANCDQRALHNADPDVRSCYDGSARFYWPQWIIDAGNAPTRDYFAWGMLPSFYELQKLCLDLAPEDDFDSLFSAARTEVVLARNRQLEAEHRQRDSVETGTGPEQERLEAELAKERRLRNLVTRRLQRAHADMSRLEEDLAAASEEVALLKNAEQEAASASPVDSERDRIRALREGNRELKRRLERREKTNNALNAENQSLKQERALHRQADSGGASILLTHEHPGNLTSLNHALNIFRDPMRRFIIDALEKTHGSDDLVDILDRSVEWRPRDREQAAENPADTIDINDFWHVVRDNPMCFRIPDFSGTLNTIKTIRNDAAHPKLSGISTDKTLDNLHWIAKALEDIGACQEKGEVEYLINIIRRSTNGAPLAT